MDLNMNNLYTKYVELEKQLAIIEDEKKVLREQILADLNKRGVEKDETEVGTFTVCRKTTWTYTEAVKKLKDKVKLAEIEEQEKNKAKASVTEYIKFTEKKDETI